MGMIGGCQTNHGNTGLRMGLSRVNQDFRLTEIFKTVRTRSIVLLSSFFDVCMFLSFRSVLLFRDNMVLTPLTA